MRRPVTSNGAVTMNTMSRTSITSTMGVTLMSRNEVFCGSRPAPESDMLVAP